MGWRGLWGTAPWRHPGTLAEQTPPFSGAGRKENLFGSDPAMRSPSWAFWAAVRAASALARGVRSPGWGDGGQ